MTYKKKLTFILFLLAGILLYTIIYVIPGVSGALKKTEIINYGELTVTDNITCYLVRNEKIYLSDTNGDINYYYEEGEHVRKGTKILDIQKNNVGEPKNEYKEILDKLGSAAGKQENDVTTFNGIVSYYIDGYEDFFTFEKMKKLKYEEVSKLNIETINLTRKKTFVNDPIYKICDNSSWYVIGWVEDGNVSKYVIGENVKIKLPKGEIDGAVEDIIEDGDKWLIIMKTDMYYAEFGKMRSGEATIITANASGIIIKNESITIDEKGNIGVYVKKKNKDYEFTPIKVINTDGEISAVEVSYFYDANGIETKTVDVYDEILKNGRI
ncbi:MAG TPA: HlyD family efflux transporter periplasmic adaptor subunit [Anaerovoracaceae bacterium]|nr:HlyD family efflux transporter periplasmic adaptor subunit [Anaerovoracaceae bacterium]